MKSFFKFLGITIFILVLIFVTLKIFQPKLLDMIFMKVGIYDQKSEELLIENHELSIVYSGDLSSFDPTTYSHSDRARLLNIYEGLTKLDRNMGIIPGLAKSFGILNDLEWEFTLRQGVRFHDGTDLEIEDVIASFDKALYDQNSKIASLLSNIKKVEKVNKQTIKIKTLVPDALLPAKIATVLIFPSEKKDLIYKEPIGTGPYKFVNYQENNFLKLEAFDGYWGKLPKYKYATLNTVFLKEERLAQMNEGLIDILDNVPIYYVDEVKNFGAKIYRKPSLEVSFLMFNLDDKENNIFKHKQIREAFLYAINKEEIVSLMKGYAAVSNQFAGRGILGYSSAIKNFKYDKKRAQELIKRVDPFYRLNAQMDTVKGVEVLGDLLKNQMFELGIDLNINYMEQVEFQKKISKGESNFYLLNWKYDFGDISDFLTSIAHSKTEDGKYGQYNGTLYKNSVLDKMIEESEQLIDTDKRIKKLNEIMKKIVEDDILGVPLFETDVLYAVKNGIFWEPRMDGYILATDVK